LGLKLDEVVTLFMSDYCHSPFYYQRRLTREVVIGDPQQGGVIIGGTHPVARQSMLTCDTMDTESCVQQTLDLVAVGCQIVRVTAPTVRHAANLEQIVKELRAKNCYVPLVADIHFHYRRGIEAAEAGAACLRINPGIIGSPDRVREVVQAAKDHGCSMRIGVNAGSLEKHLLEQHGGPTVQAMVDSALFHARILEDNDFFDFKISVKASNVALAVGEARAAELMGEPNEAQDQDTQDQGSTGGEPLVHIGEARR